MFFIYSNSFVDYNKIFDWEEYFVETNSSSVPFEIFTEVIQFRSKNK